MNLGRSTKTFPVLTGQNHFEELQIPAVYRGGVFLPQGKVLHRAGLAAAKNGDRLKTTLPHCQAS